MLCADEISFAFITWSKMKTLFIHLPTLFKSIRIHGDNYYKNRFILYFYIYFSNKKHFVSFI